MPRVAVSTCRRHPRRRTSLPTKTVRSSFSDRQTRGSTSPELSAHSLTLSSHWSFRHSLHDSRRCRGNGIVRLDERSRSRRSHCPTRSEEHTSELQSLMRISYAVFCLKKKKINYDRIPYKPTN